MKTIKFYINNMLFLLITSIVIIFACNPNSRDEDLNNKLITISEKALYDTNSLFYANYKTYPKERNLLPLGVFDSGTGGLTVLEAMLTLDEFNNNTGEQIADGIPDFLGEKFIYLADQVNMPYGNYAAENKTDFLRELIVKDALFLTSPSVRSKLVVIACNTATAYGLNDISNLFEKGDTKIGVIGVINAAVNEVFEKSLKSDSIAVGVMATVGTISSGGYEKTIRELAVQKGFIVPVVINQAGQGFAEAVDGEIDYIDKKSAIVRKNYRGPVIGYDTASINPHLMEVYNFDITENALLLRKDGAKINEIQLNSPGNYARFHLVNMIEKFRKKAEKTKLKMIILGCTHYPYFKDTLEKCLFEIRNYNNNGIYPYKDLLADSVYFIDPAKNVAIQTYKFIRDKGLIAQNSSQFSVTPYITVPSDTISLENLDKFGNFTYEYKYGRDDGEENQSFKTVTFSKLNINKDNLERIKLRLPVTYSNIKSFTE